MQKYEASLLRTDRAWTGPHVATIAGAAVKLRWTDRPFRWHRNAGDEVFAVLAGAVDMHVRDAEGERIVVLEAGDLLHIGPGEEHVAHPRGAAAVLVIEGEGE